MQDTENVKTQESPVPEPTVEPWTRTCAVCRGEFEWDGADYKTVCTNCYRTKTRSCAVCHVGVIKATAPNFHTVCTTCWVDNRRQKGYSVCPRCPPERAGQLRRQPGQQYCAECVARLGGNSKQPSGQRHVEFGNKTLRQ